MSIHDQSTTDTPPSQYDLIVIGGGGVGSTVAFEAVGRGVRVALVERWKLGGTCLNTGCDPTKALVRSAEVTHLAPTSARFGIATADVVVDWPVIRQRVAAIIDHIRGGDGPRNVRDKGIDFYPASAAFTSPTSITAGDRTLTADRFFIATGASNRPPEIEGIGEVGYITNDDVPDLEAVPASLAIVGGGPVAVEFCQIFARLGVHVTLLASRDQILPREDPELAGALRGCLEHEGIRIETGVRVRSATVSPAGKTLHWDGSGGERSSTTAEVMIATGRRPNVDALALDRAGVTLRDDGIEVDATMRTTVPRIWAAGDVTGHLSFTHVGDYGARIAEHNMFEPDDLWRADYRAIPWVTFTDPELARVGLTEAEATDCGHTVVTATTAFADLARAVVADQREGMVKLVVDRATRQILGGHVLGAGGGELVGEIALAMRARLPVDAIVDTVHPYPTMSEAVFWTAYDIVHHQLGES